MALVSLQYSSLWEEEQECFYQLLPKLLQPLYNADKIKSELYQRQEKQKTYYDRNAKLLDPLKEGDRVALKNESKGMWIPASVQMANNQPQSYTVESNGGVYRRNRRDLMKYGEVVDQRAFEQPAVITKPAVTFGQPCSCYYQARITLCTTDRYTYYQIQ